MFQSFNTVNDKSRGPVRLTALREELALRGLDGFLVPREDAHQGEYVPACDCRLEWLTGFTGSAGVAGVLAGKAAIFVDGRYTIQVREQVEEDAFAYRHLHDEPMSAWLGENVSAGQMIGYDPMLHPVRQVRVLKAAVEKVGAELVGVESNPIDAVWPDRPEAPLGAVTMHGMQFAGESAADKLKRIGDLIALSEADTALLTQPDSIAWLLNIRGSDVTHTPLPLSFALVPSKGKPSLFIDGRKLSNEVRDELSSLTEIEAPSALLGALAALGTDGKRVLVDTGLAGQALYDAVATNGGKVVEGQEPTLLPKAIKNPSEIEGARAAHLRDGVAYANFLTWFEKTAPLGELTEVSVAEKLEAFRRETGALKDISFDTISAAGPHGAICHYRVSNDSNLPIELNSVYLIDSGAQYEDGTTDITRTLAVGAVTGEQCKHFTLVLKSHIAIATARFPVGTVGSQLDTLARIELWKQGLDFDHGTGHGVGSYLGVHEGPQRISKAPNSIALKPGMILSNEPGYYRAGEYGIRIENLELVSAAAGIAGGDQDMLGFEALTLAPIDLRMVDIKLLSPFELNWLNTYHARVNELVGPLLGDEARAWLEETTRPVS
ncbi:aminopeptidase P family protein [Pseudovibrio sp. Tun.PSC04-5.I4]|uniref:aminopeptidase P family protein n=1 Tax=Pseudovibrio sp. Tun.PSC04-5.I4 TaxID=1798213 RepID=UPI00089217E3|nr:aminopeptidase P family protein [Pseudovibrio sp. Tun.PSC04-5.I4]SDR35972.1 Xaa-Pro aminopeptidase [Pseudovibrio sp. Tun.PSC04-5.I4]